jgi:hypothetical protein
VFFGAGLHLALHAAKLDLVVLSARAPTSSHGFTSCAGVFSATSIPVPRGTHGYDSSADRSKESSAPVGILQAVAIDLEGVRIDGVNMITRDAAVSRHW